MTTRFGKQVITKQNPWDTQYFETVEESRKVFLRKGILTGNWSRNQLPRAQCKSEMCVDSMGPYVCRAKATACFALLKASSQSRS